MGIYFQEEIIMDMLSRLPPKSLFRFKCVSKFWETLILDHYFKRMHLNRAKNDQNCQKFIVSQSCPDVGNTYSFSCSYISPSQVEDTQKLDFHFTLDERIEKGIQTIHDFPSKSIPWSQKFYCCCDGLFVTETREYPGRHLTILLYNPTTRESMVLPHSEFPPDDLCTWGLGYDSISDDYKILKIHPRVCSEILTLKSGLWRKIDNHPTGICPDLSATDSLAFIHGAFHWIGSSLNHYTVVTFNISNEVYGEILLPENLCLIANVEYVERGISVLDGKLCAYYTSTYLRKGTFKLWIMQDYGVKESWQLSCSIIEYPNLCSIIPKCWNEHYELILYSCKLLNAVARRIWTNHEPFVTSWPREHIIQDGFSYTESLIFPKLIT